MFSYSSYNKETSLANRLDIYEDDFIDDGDDDTIDDGSYYSSSPDEDEIVKRGNSSDDQSAEDENQLHTSISRKRKGILGSSDDNSDSDIGGKEKRIRYFLNIRYSRYISCKQGRTQDT